MITRSVVSTMEASRHIIFNDNSVIDRNILSHSSLDNKKQKELDEAVGIYIDINTDKYIGVKSDWSGNGSTGTIVPNETKAKFDSRQLKMLKNRKGLHLYSKEKEVREVLTKTENNYIVALLIDPIAERKQYELSSENDKTPVMRQEIETSLSNNSVTNLPVLESKYPKYTP